MWNSKPVAEGRSMLLKDRSSLIFGPYLHVPRVRSISTSPSLDHSHIGACRGSVVGIGTRLLALRSGFWVQEGEINLFLFQKIKNNKKSGPALGSTQPPSAQTFFFGPGEGGGRQKATTLTVAGVRAASLKVTSGIPKCLNCRIISIYVQYMYNYA
jgi:hypothetical protein